MLYRRQVTVSFFNPAVLLPLLLSVCIFSCVAPKKNQYPKRRPFVYETNIKLVDAKLRRDERQDLTARLRNQLDDSLQIRTVTALRWRPPFIYKRLMTPAVFDSLHVSRSIVFMTSLLNSIGYYAPVIKDTFRIDSTGDQYRVTTDFRISPGKRLTFDSIAYDLETPELQALVMKSKSESLLKKGKPYSKQILSDEITRLVDTLRNNGYYKFTKEDLYVEHDTVVAALIDPTLDPLQQAALLEELNKRRENPTINVSVKQRPVRDSSHLNQYYIGKVTVYPDLPILEDTAVTVKNDTTNIRRVELIYRSNKFKLPFIVNNIFLRPGRLYRQENYYRTSNRLSQLSAWQVNYIDFDDSELSDTLVDITVRMYPAKKQNMNVSLEASRNTTNIVTTSNLFGIGVNLGLQNRNAFKQSVRTTTDLRGGVELGGKFIQTTQASISHTIAFPQLIQPFPIRREGRLKNVQTIVNVNASYTDRLDFYTLRSIAGSWGYQWTKNNKTFIWKPLNIEYSTLSETDSLDNILKSNPSLKLAFRTGLVVGLGIGQMGYTSVKQKGNKTNIFRVTFEESGALTGFISSWDRGDLFRFFKGDVEYSHNINYGKTQLVMRAYGGAGFSYGKQKDGSDETTLPFYKAYFAGGPNSMRAWQVRRLGLGSSKFYADTPQNAIDRFGDIQLEGNIEYRFPLGTIYGVKLKSAFYADVGNVWNRDTTVAGKGSDFQFDRFFKEFAVGAGTGLRLDFNYFLIRLDWAYKIRDPQRKEYSDRWFYGLNLGSGQFQLGINYPF